jgi:putative endonuclease
MRSSANFGPPEVFVDRNKRQNLRNAAKYYLYKKGWQGNLRFDVVAVLKTETKTEIEHFEDAFH